MMLDQQRHNSGTLLSGAILKVVAELSASSQFFYDLHCIGISVDSDIGFDFALQSGGVSVVLFL